MKIAALSIADYAEATEGMPHDVERLYFRMILKMYSREGGIPDDDKDCARIFGYRDVRTYKALKAKLLAWPDAIELTDGLLMNSRVAKEIEAKKQRSEMASEYGKLGGRPKKIDQRSDEDQAEIDPRSRADLEMIPYATDNENNYLEKPFPTPSPSPSPKEENPIDVEQEPQHAGFSGSFVSLTDDEVTAMAGDFANLIFPADLRAADFFLHSRNPDPNGFITRDNRLASLNTYLAKRNREAQPSKTETAKPMAPNWRSERERKNAEAWALVNAQPAGAA